MSSPPIAMPAIPASHAGYTPYTDAQMVGLLGRTLARQGYNMPKSHHVVTGHSCPYDGTAVRVFVGLTAAGYEMGYSAAYLLGNFWLYDGVSYQPCGNPPTVPSADATPAIT